MLEADPDFRALMSRLRGVFSEDSPEPACSAVLISFDHGPHLWGLSLSMSRERVSERETTAAKLMLATLLETVSNRLPICRLWNVVDDISGHVAGSPKTVQVFTAEAARLLVEAFHATHVTALQGQVQGSHRRHGQAQAGPFATVGGSWGRRVRFGRDNVGADLQLGRRPRALVVRGRLARAARHTK